MKHKYYFVESYASVPINFVKVSEISEEFENPFDLFERFEFKMRGDYPY